MDAGSLLRATPHLVVSRAKLTSTGIALVVLSADGESPKAVITLAMNDAAVDRLRLETATLLALHGDDRLGPWRELVPRPISTGTFRGQRYRVDVPLAGENVTRSLEDRQLRYTILDAAAGSIRVLHRATAQTISGGPALARQWVDLHVLELLRVVGHDARLRLALPRLREELYGVVCDGEFTASRIHGDYWPGNLLFSGVASRRPALVGIVDWDASHPAETPLHDLLHLVLYTRRLLTGRELGDIVSEQLRGAQWAAEERIVLDGRDAPVWEGLSERDALMLYWLRQMAMHIRQQTAFGGWRLRVWQRRNLHPVLESL